MEEIPEGQVYVPRLEPMAPIRLAGWCSGVMDSARDFYLLDEPVP